MHCCPEKELRLLVQEDEEEVVEIAKETRQKEEELQGWEMVCHVVELNELQSHVGTCCKTMKLEGCLQEVPILLLIDSGASHNYITRELVQFLNLPISKTR